MGNLLRTPDYARAVLLSTKAGIDPPTGGDAVAVRVPFEGAEFMAMGFDPRDAKVSVLATPRNGMPVTGYSDLSRADAVQDASAAVGRARKQGLPLRYTVVRIAADGAFSPRPRDPH